MSLPLVNLPTPPQRAHVRHSETIAAGTTRFQPFRYNILKKDMERRRRQVMNEGYLKPSSPKKSSSPNKSKTTKSSIFKYFKQETKKKESASCVFLLWGSENSETSNTWAVDDENDEEEKKDEKEIFDLLKKKYNKELGLLRFTHIFQRFRRLRPVTFRLICKDSKRFLAFIQPIDLDKLHKSYSEQQKKAMEAIELITDFDSNDFPDCCYQNNSGEYNHCNIDCPTLSSEPFVDSTCPFQEWYRCNDQIRWIETVPFLSCYFRNPAGAKSQKILTGSSDHRFIYHYSNISRPVNDFEFQNRYLELNGLYVETAWCPVKSLIAFLSTLFSSVIIGGIFFWGSWEIIFGAGSFIIALLMLVLTGLSRYDV
ncbi:hypothetical protein J3E73DRAFT_232819 [Bipolaris maydis]|nr:hypothetical protein J3E73DRAFT_232819 [Bipolaris maydis]